MSETPQPTGAELEILQVLWQRGPSTVRDVYEALAARRGYTTILKLMQIMADKGLVTRDKSSRSHIYQARHRQEVTQKRLLQDLIAKAFGGSIERLVMQALSTKKATPAEIVEIRRLLDELERKQR